ncbi:MAG: YCF48-related protein [Pseudomonadota bacterium]
MRTHMLKFTLAALLGFSAAALAEGAAQPMGNLQPRAAEMARLSDKNLLLGLSKAGDQLVAVGDRGTVLLSADGTQWQQMPAPVHATLTAVSFADGKNGWIGGHDSTILHTDDGGQTWKLQSFNAKDSKPVLGVLALDAQRAYAVGAYGMFLSTIDAGATWSPVVAPAILQDGLHLNAMIKLNNGDLFLAGETGLAGVLDNGQTWRRLKLPYDGSLFGALPRGERGALVFGLRGNVFATSDVRSNAWTRINTGTVQSFYSGTILPSGDALLVGADGAVLLVGADNKARLASSNDTGASYAAVLPWKDGLLVTSELGIGRIATPGK